MGLHSAFISSLALIKSPSGGGGDPAGVRHRRDDRKLPRQHLHTPTALPADFTKQVKVQALKRAAPGSAPPNRSRPERLKEG